MGLWLGLIGLILIIKLLPRILGIDLPAEAARALRPAAALARSLESPLEAVSFVEPGEEAQAFVQHLTVFVMACFVGWHVIWNVTPALHTPLMAVTNAISGIIILGGLQQGSEAILLADGSLNLVAVFGLAAILLAMINVAGGFLVTQRMLKMFRRD